MYAFPRSGDMTEQIAVEFKHPDGTWSLANVSMAELIPETGKEVVSAEGIKPYNTVRFRTRYSRVLATMDTRKVRLINKGAMYNVTYVEDTRNAHVELYIVAERTV